MVRLLSNREEDIEQLEEIEDEMEIEEKERKSILPENFFKREKYTTIAATVLSIITFSTGFILAKKR